MAQSRWQPDRTMSPTPWPMPPLGTALARGFVGRCPSCGKTKLFDGYLRVTRECGNCGAPLGSARADDAPPYFTIVVVGHIVIPSLLWMQKAYDPSTFVLSMIFLPLTIVLSLGLLRPIKGATVGLMLRLNMLKPNDEMDTASPTMPVVVPRVTLPIPPPIAALPVTPPPAALPIAKLQEAEPR